MPKYLVTVKEIWEQLVEVEAENEEEARMAIFLDADGTHVGEPEFQRMFDPSDWTVEEAEGPLMHTFSFRTEVDAVGFVYDMKKEHDGWDAISKPVQGEDGNWIVNVVLKEEE